MYTETRSSIGTPKCLRWDSMYNLWLAFKTMLCISYPWSQMCWVDFLSGDLKPFAYGLREFNKSKSLLTILIDSTVPSLTWSCSSFISSHKNQLHRLLSYLTVESQLNFHFVIMIHDCSSICWQGYNRLIPEALVDLQ